jgi:asparagine synthase (glutamine-hydrolysing)
MSGIVGILNLDGAPIDRILLARLTNSLAFRGPDAQRIWCHGQIGLGHALLQSAVESKNEHQPLTLDGNSWIVADARVDGRRDLIARLRPHIPQSLDHVPDVDLILRAYQVWGENCVDHLIGDFAFAIWNARQRRLFCARDHFGIKPFFYARAGNSLIFSNTLDCLRLHPKISHQLNELAIADFLLFDNNQDLGTTAFAEILRLPPAHTLACQDATLAVRRYWRLPEEAPLDIRRSEECLAQFREVFDAAVSDRLRGDSAGILLSGGLDSPAVAASARRVLERRNSAFDFRAYTYVHDHLIPHEEKHYAGLVAKSLNIPISFLNADESRLYDNYDEPEYRMPEPAHFPMGFRTANPYAYISEFSRTVLTGFGGDPALACLLSAHFGRLFKARRFGRAVADVLRFLGAEGRLSRLYVRTRFRHWFGQNAGSDFIPWFNPDFAKRLGLRERWETLDAQSCLNQSARPEAYSNVASPYWTLDFGPSDPGILGFTVESCHPFFDLRVLKFLLALPALPWCSDKELLRQAERGVLPDAVRLRKKSPLMRDPIVALLEKPESAWVDAFESVPELGQYVRRESVPPVYRIADPSHAWTHLRPLSLNLWLERRDLIHTDRHTGILRDDQDVAARVPIS